jgi:hyperosmotically inducible protein
MTSQKQEERMSRFTVEHFLAVTLVAALLVAAIAARAAQQEGAASPEFTRLDVDHDGYLSRVETAGLEEFDNAFREADDNGDGRLDAAEFLKAQAIRDRARAGQFVEDSVITARVKAELIKDPLVKAFDVKVETRKGVVLLSGFVDKSSQARRAAELARGVSGVVNVKNGLVVRG